MNIQQIIYFCKQKRTAKGVFYGWCDSACYSIMPLRYRDAGTEGPTEALPPELMDKLHWMQAQKTPAFQDEKMLGFLYFKDKIKTTSALISTN